MKKTLIFLLLTVFTSCIKGPRSYMKLHQKNSTNAPYYSFDGKIVGQDSLRWDIDLNGDDEPEIFAFKQDQVLNLHLNDYVYGDDFDDHYIIRIKK